MINLSFSQFLLVALAARLHLIIFIAMPAWSVCTSELFVSQSCDRAQGISPKAILKGTRFACSMGVKRLQTDADRQPGASNNADGLQPGGPPPPGGSGLQPVPDKPSITPQEFLRIYSSEKRLFTLNKLSVSIYNRKGKPLNSSHMLRLMMRWYKGSKNGGEDFARYRYNVARVLEPNPQDPHEGSRHTNAMADQDDRIRKVEDDSKDGLHSLVSKSHCWGALWAMDGRNLKVDPSDPDSPTIQPPTDQPDLKFAMEEGLWCEVIRWQGAVDYPEVLTQLMQSENFDAASSLAEDEISLLRDIKDKQQQGAVEIRGGEREYDALLREVLGQPGQVYKATDVWCRYNLCKIIGYVHVHQASEGARVHGCNPLFIEDEICIPVNIPVQFRVNS